MDKKYSVFVSFTYTDLVAERKQVIDALLQMNCFPIGMEYFNAEDDTQWNIIKNLIKECDYYIIIIAGRYGSIEKESGKSYTQKEYEYAIEQGIPVLRFVHEDINRLTGDKLEDTDEGKRKLKAFTDEAKKKMCKFWTTPGELAAQVVLSLTSMIKTNPRIGWIKGDVMTSEKSNSEIIRLKDENEELRAKIKKMEESAPAGIEDLSQGDDLYAVHFDYVKTQRGGYEKEFEDGSQEFSWNDIFSYLSPYLLIECEETSLELLFNDFVRRNADSSFFGRVTKVYSENFQNVKVQFIALGLIQESQRKKSAGNVHKYWTLTPYGNKIMMKLKAIKKNRN